MNMRVEAKPISWDNLDVPIKYDGRAITLPGDPGEMPLGKAIEALVRKQKDEEQPYEVHEVIDAYPLDAAVAFVKAMTKLYGWASPQTVKTMFGDKPPHMISVKVGKNDADVVQCPLGAFKLPGVDQLVHTVIQSNKFIIHATIEKKHKHLLLELATETRKIVKEESIYRGKAIRLTVDTYGELDFDNPPSFMDVSDTDETSLIFDADIQSQIDNNILVPIKHTAECRAIKIPLKRGILLEGPYGTGKSLTARMTANMCELNGWTFILLDKVQGLRVALEFAKRYSPAVVFAEDIDRVMSERNEDANDLINTIDGVVSKGTEIMTILTTNFADKLDPVIVRPGRLDAVISLRAPSDEAVRKLIRVYAGSLLAENANVDKAAKELSGQIPASIRECVERAKLGMIGRGSSSLSDADVTTAAKTMKNHLALLNRKKTEQTMAEKLAESLSNVVRNGNDTEKLHDKMKEIGGTIENIEDKSDSLYSKVDEVDDNLESLARRVNKVRDIAEDIRENMPN
jgi:ATP-dependent 26S proteasome regulatory subunit